MFNNHKEKEIVSYYRDSTGGLGPSKVRVFAAEPGKKETYELDGKIPITIKTFDTKSNLLKPYICIEEYVKVNLVTYDIMYGNLDIPTLISDEYERKVAFTEKLDRSIIELFTRKACGVIPSDVLVYSNGKKEISSYDGLILEELSKVMKNMVLQKSVFFESREIENQSQKGSNDSSRPKPRKGFWDRVFGEKMGNKSDDSSSYQTDKELSRNQNSSHKEQILFYRSGVVLFNGNTFLKFNYITKDRVTVSQALSSSKSPAQCDSFLISDFDEDRLNDDIEYRKAFVNEVLTPYRLKSAREVTCFPYIGEFTSSGKFENNLTNWLAFNKLNEKINDYGER